MPTENPRGEALLRYALLRPLIESNDPADWRRAEMQALRVLDSIRVMIRNEARHE